MYGSFHFSKDSLHQQNADIGVGAIAMMLEREKILDFTYPFYEGAGFIILVQML